MLRDVADVVLKEAVEGELAERPGQLDFHVMLAIDDAADLQALFLVLRVVAAGERVGEALGVGVVRRPALLLAPRAFVDRLQLPRP